MAYFSSHQYNCNVVFKSFESWDGRRHERYTNLKIKVENETSFDVSDVEDVRVILRASYPFTPTGGEYYVGELKKKKNKLYATIGAILIMMLGVKKVIKSRRKKNE